MDVTLAFDGPFTGKKKGYFSKSEKIYEVNRFPFILNSILSPTFSAVTFGCALSTEKEENSIKNTKFKVFIYFI
jgi:hypothetical protein